MPKVRFWLRLISVFLKRFTPVILFGIILGIFVFLIVRTVMPTLASKVTHVGMTGRFTPDELPRETLSLIGDGLTKIGEDGIPEPGLAREWEASESGKVWTFKLDTNKSWHDGTKVSSYSVPYAFEDVVVEKPDNETIVFRLTAPFAPFPVVVAKPVFKKGLLGTGEWRVKKLVLSANFVERLILTKEKETVEIRFFPNEERTKLALKLGEVDEIREIYEYKPFSEWKTVNIMNEEFRNRFVVLFFNNQSNVLSDKTMRQALSYAVNKANFPGSRAISPISPDSWAYNAQVKPYEYSPERAKELIEDLPNDFLSDVNLKLYTAPSLLSLAESISKDWKEVGVNSTVQVANELPVEFDAFLVIFDAPRDPDQYQTWHSTQKDTNISKYQNPRIDKLLEDGRLTVDEAARKKIYLDFQRFLLEDAPALFLYHPVFFDVARK